MKSVTVSCARWDESSINAVGSPCRPGGAAAVAAWQDTEQGYSGKAVEYYQAGKGSSTDSVIGSSDIRAPSYWNAAATGCDAVMIRRGVLGNLWLIRRTVHFLETGELLPEQSLRKKPPGHKAVGDGCKREG